MLSIAGDRTMRDRFVKNNGCDFMARKREQDAHHDRGDWLQEGLSSPVGGQRRQHIQAAASAPAAAEGGNKSWVSVAVWSFVNLPELQGAK